MKMFALSDACLTFSGPPPNYWELSQDDKRYWLILKKIHIEQQKKIKARKRF